MAISRQIIRVQFISPLKLLKSQNGSEIKAKKMIARLLDKSDFNQLVLTDSSRNSFYWVLSQLRKFVKKKKIILAGYNFSLMKDIAIKAGFEPLYADASLEDFNISVESIKTLINKDVGVAILPHIFGIPIKKEIFDELKRHDIFIIEDCAHTYPLSLTAKKQMLANKGAKKPTTTENYIPGTVGDIAIYSFNFSKQISATYGGLIVLNDLKNPRFNEFRELFFSLNKSIRPKEILKEIKTYFKSVVSSLIFSRLVFNMIVFPMIINANKKENEEDIIDRLSKDPKGFIPSPIKRMGKLGITHLMLSIKDFLKRFDKIFYIQKEYNLISKSRGHGEFSKTGNIKDNFGRVQFLYPVIVKDLKLAKRALLKKGIDVKKEYCVDISNGFCENAKFLEEHVLCIPFHEGINRKEINIVKSELKTLVIS